jgi:thiamine biosynthesis protein ThiS
MIEVNGKPHPWRVELTLDQLMAEVDPRGEIAVVRLGDRLVSRPNYPTTRVPDGAVLRLIPMVAGG